jgi:hypothetical protein
VTVRIARIARIARVRPWLQRALAFTAVLVAASVLRADAPLGQYAGFDHYSRCITDVQTHLTWVRTPTLAVDYPSATNACAVKDAGGGSPAWRLPSVNELETLVDDFPTPQSDPSGNVEVRAIDANAFPGTPIGHYWTSSPVGSNFVWTVEFGGGSTAAASTTADLEAFRCVTEQPTQPASCNP